MLPRYWASSWRLHGFSTPPIAQENIPPPSNPEELRDCLGAVYVTEVLCDSPHLIQVETESTMLGALIKLWRSMTVVQGRLALCNVSAAEQEVLTATRLDSVWSIYPTRAAAIATIGDRCQRRRRCRRGRR